jgi:hypothetical protein
MKRAAILQKLDGWGTPVCHYQQATQVLVKDAGKTPGEQSMGICAGVSLEWLRRVILKGKDTLYSGDPTNPVGTKGTKKYTKEQRWEMTQNAIYHIDSRKAAALLHDHSITGDFDDTARQELDDLPQLKQDLKKAREALTIGGGNLVPVSAISDKVAQFAKGYGMNPKSLLPAQLARLEKSAESRESSILHSAKERAYVQWKGKDAFSIETGVFKECSKDLANQCFDEKGIELRARFSGLKVVDGANKLKVNTVKPLEAIKAALGNPLFEETRGLWFFVSFQDKDGRATDGHASAVYYGQGVRKFLFLDPNFGLWRMTDSGVKLAVHFLYNEGGPYGDDGSIPRGFEYSIWEKT